MQESLRTILYYPAVALYFLIFLGIPLFLLVIFPVWFLVASVIVVMKPDYPLTSKYFLLTAGMSILAGLGYGYIWYEEYWYPPVSDDLRQLAKLSLIKISILDLFTLPYALFILLGISRVCEKLWHRRCQKGELMVAVAILIGFTILILARLGIVNDFIRF